MLRKVTALVGRRRPPSGGGLVDPRVALLSTFPLELRADVERVLPLFETLTRYDRLFDQPVLVDGAELNVLERFGGAEPSAAQAGTLSPTQRLIVAVMLSKHYDGHIRERNLEALFVDAAWTIPSRLLLVSEYVVEIADRAVAISDPIPASRYQVFAADNPAFMSIIRSRIVSYWSCYHRPYRDWYDGSLGSYGWGRPMPFIEFPGYRFLAHRGLWTGREARHRIRRELRARP
jgi:hypothetical protein